MSVNQILFLKGFPFQTFRFKLQVATTNKNVMDAVISMNSLTHFYFGLKTEWLESMTALLSNKEGAPVKDSFPVVVNGLVEMYTLTKLYKTLSSAMPMAQKVKILKMPKSATRKQYISTQK